MLNPKQQKFCEEYLTDLNATQSAVRAGYSRTSAKQVANRLLAVPAVKDKIAQLLHNRSDQLNVLQEAMTRKLWDIANEDIKNFLSFGPQKVTVTDPRTGVLTEKDMGMQVTFKDSDSIDTRNIMEISLKKNGDFKFRLGSREKALDLLAKRLDTLARATANHYSYRETIEPIFLSSKNNEQENTHD